MATTTRDWEAWIDVMPGRDPELHVIAVCEFPTTGYTAELERQEPPEFNARDLLLRLVVNAPTGAVKEVVTDVPVEFTAPAAEGELDTVSIVPDGPLGIPVKTTH